MDHDRTQLERKTFFFDAVFAIAMTLLVIEVRVPAVLHATDHALAQALVDQPSEYIGFVVSFIVLGRFRRLAQLFRPPEHVSRRCPHVVA